jgi:FAD/FMN-containing dehydrogenase
VLKDFLVRLWEKPQSLLNNALFPRPEEAWSLRHSISEGVRTQEHPIAFDLSFERGRLIEFIAYAKEKIPKHFPTLQIFDFGHLGDGGVHFNLVANVDDFQGEIAAGEAKTRDWVIETCVTKFGGSYSGEHGIGRKNLKYYNQFTSKLITQISADLKQLLSPRRLGFAQFHTPKGDP